MDDFFDAPEHDLANFYSYEEEKKLFESKTMDVVIASLFILIFLFIFLLGIDLVGVI